MKEQEMYDRANRFERSRLLLLEQSAARSWKIALGASLVCILSWIALVCLLPLKTVEPYVIRVDRATGVPDIVTRLSEEDVSFDETLNKYFLAKYTRARETYDWYTLQQDYNEARLFSTQAVGSEYAALFEGENALDTKYGKNYRVSVQIKSVVPTSQTTGTVRFTKTLKHVEDPGDGLLTDWVATIAFRYGNPERIPESERLVNPLGFEVTSYRVDSELLGGM